MVRTTRGRALTLASICALVLAMAATAAMARPSASTSLLRVASTASITTWDPIKSFSTEVLYMANIYEPLVYANPPGAGRPFRPALATNWGRSKDGKTWTFRLRQGVKFTNGEPLTADAVKASIEAAAKRGGASFITPTFWLCRLRRGRRCRWRGSR